MTAGMDGYRISAPGCLPAWNGVAGTTLELPAGRRLQQPTVTLLDGRLSRRADGLALQLDGRTWDAPDRCSADACRTAGMLGIICWHKYFCLDTNVLHRSTGNHYSSCMVMVDGSVFGN